MRVAEYGLRALARERCVVLKNISLEYADWGTILKELDEKLKVIKSKSVGPV